MFDTRGSGVGGVDRVGDVDAVSCSGGGGDRSPPRLINRDSATANASNESSSIVLPWVVAHPMAVGREGSGGSGDGAGRGWTCSVSGWPGDGDGGDPPSYTANSKVVVSSCADMSALSSG
jgi:hypothetical protein